MGLCRTFSPCSPPSTLCIRSLLFIRRVRPFRFSRHVCAERLFQIILPSRLHLGFQGPLTSTYLHRIICVPTSRRWSSIDSVCLIRPRLSHRVQNHVFLTRKLFKNCSEKNKRLYHFLALGFLIEI